MCGFKRVLYGTGNQAKLQTMRRRLAGLKLEILGLQDMGGCRRKCRRSFSPASMSGEWG